MRNRNLLLALVALAVIAATAFALTLTSPPGTPEGKGKTVTAAAAPETRRPVSDPCASNATYARLKQAAFADAIRIRNADPANLETLAASAVVRMENPVVKSRDETLGTTVCQGRLVLELPPGAERAFAGERRLTADVEYSAQPAADNSGPVYRMRGAEPIIYRLAAFDLQGGTPAPPPARPTEDVLFADAADAPAAPEPSAPGMRPHRDELEPSPPAPKAPQPRPRPKSDPMKYEPLDPPRRVDRTGRPGRVEEPQEARPRPAPVRAANRSNPSFSCNGARNRSERMVCSSNRLAAKDRAMSSLFFSARADADPRTRRELERTRNKFLAYRNRCPDEACVAEAYDGRMEEIRDIMAASE